MQLRYSRLGFRPHRISKGHQPQRFAGARQPHHCVAPAAHFSSLRFLRQIHFRHGKPAPTHADGLSPHAYLNALTRRSLGPAASQRRNPARFGLSHYRFTKRMLAARLHRSRQR